MPLSRGECSGLDGRDPLAGFRGEFVVPEGVVYLDGNSLGALPRGTSGRVRRMVEQEWGQGLIRSWNEAGWWELPVRLGELLGPLVGAGPGQVIVTDGTSANIFKVLAAALRMRPGRDVVLAEESSFPTDLYIAQGLADALGAELSLISDGERLGEALREPAGRVAAVLLNHVDYRTGRMLDMAGLTELIHEHGALAVWDLCHSAGAVPVELDACQADFAVGCGYKYLNGGPGSPAFIYAAERHIPSVRQPLAGWWGHAEPFAFDPGYEPDAGMRRFLTGSQPVLSGAALEVSLEIWSRVDMDELRTKSLAMTETFMRRAHEADFEVVTPWEPHRRGSQVSLRYPGGDGYAIVQALIDRGVIGDFRAPDIMRFGFAPLYLRYCDVWEAADALTDIVKTGAWRAERYATRNTVT